MSPALISKKNEIAGRSLQLIATFNFSIISKNIFGDGNNIYDSYNIDTLCLCKNDEKGNESIENTDLKSTDFKDEIIGIHHIKWISDLSIVIIYSSHDKSQNIENDQCKEYISTLLLPSMMLERTNGQSLNNGKSIIIPMGVTIPITNAPGSPLGAINTGDKCKQYYSDMIDSSAISNDNDNDYNDNNINNNNEKLLIIISKNQKFMNLYSIKNNFSKINKDNINNEYTNICKICDTWLWPTMNCKNISNINEKNSDKIQSNSHTNSDNKISRNDICINNYIILNDTYKRKKGLFSEIKSDPMIISINSIGGVEIVSVVRCTFPTYLIDNPSALITNKIFSKNSVSTSMRLYDDVYNVKERDLFDCLQPEDKIFIMKFTKNLSGLSFGISGIYTYMYICMYMCSYVYLYECM
jgi:hypothetical protein